MRTMLKAMRMRKNGISEDIVQKFESIIDSYKGEACDNAFIEAMNDYLTEEQRFRLWECDGACRGTGQDNERKAFLAEHRDKPVPERLEIYLNTLGKASDDKVDWDDNLITVAIACDGCCKNVDSQRFSISPASYYGRCAGGRLYKYQKALGIKLKIKSIHVSPLGVNRETPCVFAYEIVG